MSAIPQHVYHDGRLFLIAPIGLLKSAIILSTEVGRMVYPSRVIARSLPLWEGTPIVANGHPNLTNRHAWRSEVRRRTIGFIRNARIVDGGILLAEAWFDQLLLRAYGPLFQALSDGRPLEASACPVGKIERSPNHCGIVREIKRVDHVSTSLNQIGAFSLEDGGGVRLDPIATMRGYLADLESWASHELERSSTLSYRRIM